MKTSMFERYGGFAVISRIVSEFYDRLLDSPEVSPYFTNVDMKRLIDHQTKFIAQVMGGPASYSNEALERVHAQYEITESAFAEMATILHETLEDFDVAEDDIAVIDGEIMSRKNFVVAKR